MPNGTPTRPRAPEERMESIEQRLQSLEETTPRMLAALERLEAPLLGLLGQAGLGSAPA